MWIWDERHALLDCTALADVRDKFPLINIRSVTGPLHPAYDGLGNHLFMVAV